MGDSQERTKGHEVGVIECVSIGGAGCRGSCYEWVIAKKGEKVMKCV